MTRYFFHIFFLLGCLTAHGQNEVVLLNGTVFKTNEIKVDSTWITFSHLTKKGELREKKFPFDDVFSVRSNGTEQVYYLTTGDTAGYLPVEDMRLVVEGYKDARVNYRSGRHWLIGAALGLGLGYSLNSGLVGIAVPPLLAVGSKIFPVNNGPYRNNAGFGNENYRWGVKKQVKRMRTSRILISSALGVAGGIIVAGATN